MTKNNPNFRVPFPSSNETVRARPNPNLQLTLSPSFNETPKKKRTRTVASSSSSSPKPKHAKKPYTNAPKTTNSCTECGKTFWSMKALYGHMRCHPERQWRGINPPINHRATTVASCMSEVDHEVASSLLMLSNVTTSSSSSSDRFECGGCKKVFGSHQALGGHRASHKNVKGCFANTNVNDDLTTATTTSSDQDHQGKIVTLSGQHKCNVCFRVFSSGQALGGHMRRHLEREEEKIKDGALDLNVLATLHDLPTLDTSGCSLDLKLGL